VGVVRISRAGLTTFKTREDNPGNPEALKTAREKLSRDGYSGNLSQKAKSKVRRYVQNWLQAKVTAGGDAWADQQDVARKVCFVTLTLPAQQTHTDNEIKRLALMPFIQKLKRQHGVREYLWRAEPQKTGQLHFHLLVDVFIPHRQVRKAWNDTLAPLGYIDVYERNQRAWHGKGFRVRKELLKWWPESKQREAYERGQEEGWRNPNTTDIHALRKVKNISAYVVKYCSKDSAGRKVDGRVWDCSETVRSLQAYEVELDAHFDAVLREIARTGEAEKLEGEGFTFYRCDSKQILNLYYPAVAAGYVSHWQGEYVKLSTLAPAQTPLIQVQPCSLAPPGPDICSSSSPHP
jgi:hypothetical protein